MKVGRILSMLLALMLVFSSTSFANGTLKAPERNKSVNQSKTEKSGYVTQEDTYKFTDKVRVIVEVEGDPAITYATNQGIKYADVSESKKATLQANVLETQNKVKQKLSSNQVNMEFKESFTTVFNGFSGVVEYGKIGTIEKLPGVVSVSVSNEYERPVTEPNMNYSNELIEAQKAWEEYGYNGKGMIVGIIDTGVDPSHKDFVLTNEEEAKLQQNAVESSISENGLQGKFYTTKVPYGYNYMDENHEILDLGPKASHHGMHVAGTVAANGEIKGVSPEAQILALKVFGNDVNLRSTWGDIYVKAIDDAIILGADVLNLSLGSTAAFVTPEDPEQQAVTRAVEHGVLMSISAGNSAHFGAGFDNPYASNPDIGVVGSPGLSIDSLQVASFENAYMDMDAVRYDFAETSGQATFLSASAVHPNDVAQKEFIVEHAGLGKPADFEGKDFTGKYALVKRGDIIFTEKALNAQAVGAAGVIIYNNADGYVNMATDPAIVIPQLFMLKNDGDLLAEEIKKGTEVTLTFDGGKKKSANPNAGKMSAFSSWGLTPNLDFKPEITAPGGNIYSTLQGDAYGLMSGTSMAAPHVSGGAALVLERVDKDFNLTGRDRVELAKNMLMNTAKPMIDKGTVQGIFGLENLYSPRLQGAGLMQLHAALSTPVVVTETTTDLAKVALKEVNDEFTFELMATNYTDEAVTYNLDANVQTDLVLFDQLGYAPDELEAQELEGAIVTLNKGVDTLEVPANGSVVFEVKVNLADAKVFNRNASAMVDPEEVFPNGYFVEGFVTLANETQPTLSVPYVGFNGDWNAAPVVDGMIYDDSSSFYGNSAMVYSNEDSYYYLGFDPINKEYSASTIAISPNGDDENDQIIPVLSFLRNAKQVQYNVLDSEKNKLRTIKTDNNVRKHYHDGTYPTYTLDPANGWDGKVKNKVVEDGQYYFEIATTIDFEGKPAQKVQVPVIVDTVGPEITGTLEGNQLTYGAVDGGSGIKYIEVFVDGELQATVNEQEQHITIENAKSIIEIVAVDFAGNTSTLAVNDKNIPVITILSPETASVSDKNEVVVSGTVQDESDITEFKVQGKDVELQWDNERKIYKFETTIVLEDGAHPISIYAKDTGGNETSLFNSRTIFVDTTAPVIEVEVPERVEFEVETFELIASLSDNFSELRFYVDGDEKFYAEMKGYKMEAIHEDVSVDLPLVVGENTFELKLVDLAGHETVQTIVIHREEYKEPVEEIETGWILENGKWFYYDEEGKKVTCWYKLNDKWYFFNHQTAVMETGWVKDQNMWYYLGVSGAMQTGWQKVSGTWYLFDKHGVMQTGWQKVSGTWYLFDKHGVMQTGWQQVNGTWYLFDKHGAMQTDWQQVSGTWYLFDKHGAMQTGWKKVGATWYLFNKHGAMQIGWQKVGTKWYYFSKSGSMQTGWVTISGKKYYFSSSGEWIK
ncbi:S8 family serine peptidase [Sporosarcina saromensis]|uniref:S8 family serine peptidase n=1 Tax=Sporosarcina saromensis TaxID=359365 RepID=A0ABU4GAM9_9BACL|nr:S8 family serine peptidase [Sporosarcina saromensis]MDW0114039.1 S8 family serine peptidase [Sporosarcina saromensis]